MIEVMPNIPAATMLRQIIRAGMMTRSHNLMERLAKILSTMAKRYMHGSGEFISEDRTS